MQSPDNYKHKKIEKLIKALGIDLEFTGKEIAEILWLSLKCQELIEIQEEITTETNIDNKNDDKNYTTDDSLSLEANEEIAPIPPRETPAKTTPIYPDIDNTKQKGYSKDNLPLRIPDAPSIHKPLEFARALRPLMQKVNSGRNTILDEIETVEQTAKNNGICVPILKSEPEPWLDLVLVVDEYKSMTLWQHTIRELKQLLKHYGIFREVKIRGLSSYQLSASKVENNPLKSEENKEKIWLRLGVGKQQYFANHQELIDTAGRRLILIVSDCVAPFWHDGSILSILREWVKYQPLAIVQMLPDWMWRRTGLRIGSSVQFKNLVPGNSNQKLIIKELLLWKNMPLEQGIKIPVLTLEPQLAQAWSQMLVGKPDALASGFVLPNEFKAKSENLPQNKVEQLDAKKRVHRFRNNASPVARKLASLLSAAPMICLPVVRIIQARLLPQAQPIHIAEVFLGGLLKPIVDITPDTNSEQVEYQFVDEETRQILFKDAPVSDSQQVFDAVYQYLKEYFGKSIKDFVALLKSSKNNGENVPAFAEIAFDILKELGGDYTAFVDDLEKEYLVERLTRAFRERFSTLTEIVSFLAQLLSSLSLNLNLRTLKFSNVQDLISNLIQWAENNGVLEQIINAIDSATLKPVAPAVVLETLELETFESFEFTAKVVNIVKLKTILLVEGEQNVIQEVSENLLSQYNINVIGTDNVNEVIQLAESGEIDLILMNYGLPNSRYQDRQVDGLEIIRILKANSDIFPSLPIVGFSMFDDLANEFIERGADGFYYKKELLEGVDRRFVQPGAIAA